MARPGNEDAQTFDSKPMKKGKSFIEYCVSMAQARGLVIQIDSKS